MRRGHKIKLINNCARSTDGADRGSADGVREARRGSEEVLPAGFDRRSKLGHFPDAGGKAIEGDFTGMKFGLANALKDVRYYNQMAMEFGMAVRCAATLQTLTHAVNLGFGGPSIWSRRWSRDRQA